MTQPDTSTHQYDAAAQRSLRRVTIASVAVALTLVVAKLGAWWLSGSLSLLSSMADSFMDVLVSLVNFAAIRYALKPADSDHRFGHNSIEDIAGLVQFSFIVLTSAFIIFHSAERLINPQPIEHSDWAIGVMIFSLCATTCLVLYQRRVLRKTGSVVIAADALHYLGDVLTNASIILTLILIQFFDLEWLDPALAIGIALLIGYHAIEIGTRAYNNLMDKEMSDEDKQAIIAVIEAQQGIKGYHALKTRMSGNKPFIQLHVDLPGQSSLHDTHALTDKLEKALLAAYPGADVIIHQDPV
ncbi:MAG: divalent metal cation transporter FieF [Rickettsiales bacterium]|nr:divalent metal cation transporter FieF [Rickettsiales bacterium]